MEQKPSARRVDIKRLDWSSAFAPLSRSQQRLWFLAQADSASPAYNLTIPVRLHGKIDKGRLVGAFRELAMRQEALRTRFGEHSGIPYQEVLAEPDLEVAEIVSVGREELYTRLSEFAKAPFDLSRPPVRLAFIAAPEEELFVVSLHHLVADGWSQRLIVSELSRLYTSGAGDLASLPATYRDYVMAERQFLIENIDGAAEKWWQHQMTLAPRTSRVPGHTDLPSGSGARRAFAIPSALYEDIRALARTVDDATFFSVVLTAMHLLVARLAGQSDVALAVPMANRQSREQLKTVGMMVNTVPVVAALGDTATFRALLGQVSSRLRSAIAYQAVPLDRIVELGESGPNGEHPDPCQVMVNFLGVAGNDLDFAGVRGEVLQQVDTGAAQFELALHLQQNRGGGVSGWFEYDTSLYDTARIDLMGQRLLAVLEAVTADADQSLETVPVMPSAEVARLVEIGHVAGPDYGQTRLEELVVRAAELHPHRPAVRDEATTYSYARLVATARKTVAVLRSRGVTDGSIVAVCADRSAQLPVLLLATLMAGGAYLPLDPEHPRSRHRVILAEARPVLTVGDETYVEQLRDVTDPNAVIGLGDLLMEAEAVTDEPAQDRADATSAAYVIYTSGSTGQPKGVAVPHRGIVNRLEWMRKQYGVGADDVFLQKTPYTFDVSLWEFFLPLISGATLVMARPAGHRDPAYLAEVVRRESITMIHFVPSMFAVFVEVPGLEECTSLRHVICSGEALAAATVAAFQKRSSATVVNLYGPTEASVDVTHWTCDADTGSRRSVPIGHPIENVYLAVVDQQGRCVPLGSQGELWIGGVALAHGYLNRPELTQDRFVERELLPGYPHRWYRTGDLVRQGEDGAVEYLGRLDDQVKLRGFRIELGEIGAVMMTAPGVADACAIVRDDCGPAARLVGYLVPESGTEIDLAQVQEVLRDALPEYMVPGDLVVLPEMPLTANGKRDRGRLPAPVRSRRGDASADEALPETDITRALAAAWAAALGVDAAQVQPGDSFFDLGGDSITSLRLRAALQQQGYDIQVQKAIKHPIFRDMCHHVTDLTQAEPGEGMPELPALHSLPVSAEDSYPLSALQAGMIFHNEYDTTAPVYQVTFEVRLRLPWNPAVFQETVDTVVASHEILRTRFELGDADGAFQIVERAANLVVENQDIRSLDPERQESYLDATFRREEAKPFDVRKPPLVRLVAVRSAHDVVSFFVSFHDAIFDGWSAATFLTELFQRYLDRIASVDASYPQRNVRYSAFVAAERAALADPEARAYWNRVLDGATFLTLPRGRQQGVSLVGRSVDLAFPVPTALYVTLRQVAHEVGVSLKSVVVAAHVATLARVAGTADVLTGLVSGGRPELPGAELVLGQFLNTHPLRVSVNGTWAELAKRISVQEVEAHPYRRYPVVALQRERGGHPLFETAFNFINFHVYDRIVDRNDWEYLDGRFTDPFHYALTVNARVHPIRQQLAIVVNFNTAELDEEKAREYGQLMLAALRSIADGSDNPVLRWVGRSLDGQHRPLDAVRESHGPVRTATTTELSDDEPGEAVQTLCRLIGALLDVEGVRPEENFFELGGDSILSIQLCARAAGEGLHLSPRDVFECPTPLELAGRIADGRQADDEQPEAPAGVPVPLTTAQRHVVGLGADPDWDNVLAVVRLDEPIAEETLRERAARAVAGHPALRTRLVEQDGVWTQELLCESTYSLVVGGPHGIDSWLEQVNRSLSLADARTLAVGQYVGPEGNHLAIAVHHAVADLVSLHVIGGELAGQPMAVRPDPWPAEGRIDRIPVQPAEHATEYALAGVGLTGLVTPEAFVSRQGEEQRCSVTLTPEVTGQLTKGAELRGRTVESVLLAALGEVLPADHGGFVWVDRVVSGRPADDPARSVAVGCLSFEWSFPLPLEPDRDQALAVQNACMAAGRARPAGGRPEDNVSALRFNYVGRAARLPWSGASLVELLANHARSPRRLRTHPQELVVAVGQDDCLTLSFYWADGTSPAEATDHLRRYADTLQAWGEFLNSHGPSAAHFGLAGVSESELALLRSRIEG